MAAAAKKLSVAGWPGCSAYKQASSALQGLQAIFKDKISVNVHHRKSLRACVRVPGLVPRK
jgi:hypothetical protein